MLQCTILIVVELFQLYHVTVCYSNSGRIVLLHHVTVYYSHSGRIVLVTSCYSVLF